MIMGLGKGTEARLSNSHRRGVKRKTLWGFATQMWPWGGNGVLIPRLVCLLCGSVRLLRKGKGENKKQGPRKGTWNYAQLRIGEGFAKNEGDAVAHPRGKEQKKTLGDWEGEKICEGDLSPRTANQDRKGDQGRRGKLKRCSLGGGKSGGVTYCISGRRAPTFRTARSRDVLGSAFRGKNTSIGKKIRVPLGLRTLRREVLHAGS